LFFFSFAPFCATIVLDFLLSNKELVLFKDLVFQWASRKLVVVGITK
jgi:hypothetical protein